MGIGGGLSVMVVAVGCGFLERSAAVSSATLLPCRCQGNRFPPIPSEAQCAAIQAEIDPLSPVPTGKGRETKTSRGN